MRFSLLKKSSLGKAWAVLDSCKHNSYILPRDNDPARVAHSAYTLTTAGSSLSQIDILGELRDTHIQRTVSHIYLRPSPWYLINCSLQCDERLVILVGSFSVRKWVSILLILVWYRVWFRFSSKWITERNRNMRIPNAFEEIFCLRSDLSNHHIISA